MSNEISIVEQREIEFYGDQVTAVKLADGSVLIPVKPICEALGIDWSAQHQRINRDPILSEVKSGVVVTPSPLENNKFANPQEVTALPLDYLNGWLFGINANRVKETVRDTLLRYQRDCYKVLSDAFGRNQVTARPLGVDVEELLQNSDNPTAVAYRHAMAIANLAREQMAFMVKTEDRFVSAEARIDAIEASLGNPDRMITTAQQSEVSQAVKAIGLELGKRSGRNEFGGVYGELYRRFEISSYRQLPSAKHAEAMNFLSDWYSNITGAELPF